MIIAVNTRLLIPGKLDGIGWFTFQTLKRLTQNHPEHQFIFLFDRPFDPEFIFSSNVKPAVISPPARHPVLWYIWFEWRLPGILRKNKADIFLSTDGFLPLSLNIPSVTVIHDINFQHRPLDLPLTSRVYCRHFFPKFAAKASRIATVSEFSKSDISASYHITPSKIDVIYNGAHEFYKPLPESEQNAIRINYTGGAPYFIFIGSLHPRKNVDGLLKAFDLFKKQTGSDFKLLIVGEKFFMNENLERVYRLMEFSKDVKFTGRKEPLELSRLLASAYALVFVPHFEGFGIPLLEAMHCNVPSVASDVTSIPEVAGDTAIYADPSDVNSIALGLARMHNDKILRERLILNCALQRQKFSWDSTAQNLWEIISRCKPL